MKKYILIFIVLFAFSYARAQEQKTVVITTADIATHTSDMLKSSAIVNQFIKEHNVNVINQESSTSRFNVNMYVTKEDFDKFLTLVPDLGFLDHKNIETEKGNSDNAEDKLQIEYFQQQKTAYENELKNVTSGTERYNLLWDQVRYYDKQIYETKKNMIGGLNEDVFRINITVIDETEHVTSSDINWVNMPGAEFVYFITEIPKSDISAASYTGYSLKYLFTRGKSFAELTTLKQNSTEVTDENRYSELFMFSFGQDFYSKYFGRGQNHFLNLYTGYNLGLIFATGTVSQQLNYFISPTVGLELFKNKYFLVDTKAEYFVPFKENKNMRGFMFKASFNFVF